MQHQIGGEKAAAAGQRDEQQHAHARETEAQQAYDTLFGEVVTAAADNRVFYDGRWHFDDSNSALHTLHHLGGGQFVTVANTLTAKTTR